MESTLLLRNLKLAVKYWRHYAKLRPGRRKNSRQKAAAAAAA
jgi:hypothetical protein